MPQWKCRADRLRAYSLQERVALEWGNSVKLVYSDMRNFYPRDKADIIVSELLGSFGDNELSPECLDGVMRCLKREWYKSPRATMEADAACSQRTAFQSHRHTSLSSRRSQPRSCIKKSRCRKQARRLSSTRNQQNSHTSSCSRHITS